MLDTLEDVLVPEPQQPATHADISALRQEIQQEFSGLRRLINGAPDEDVPGIRPRLLLVEQRLKDLPTKDQWDEYKKTLDNHAKYMYVLLILAPIVLALAIDAFRSYFGGP